MEETRETETLVDGADSGPPPMAELMPLERGSSVGRYIVLELLGQGGMGVVYAAYDPKLDRKVAIKVLTALSRSKGRSEIARERLLLEARAMARLDHANVVGVHDVGVSEGEVFIAMEFIEGQTLRQWLLARKRSVDEILELFSQAGRGLGCAHAANMVHRDFKPENVMVDESGRARVLDFGVARQESGKRNEPDLPRDTDLVEGTSETASGRVTERLTQQGALVGTFAFMSPEQLSGLEVTPAADQFAFCVALYEALFDQAPFGGTGRMERIANVASGAFRPPPEREGVPERVKAAVLRGLSVDPGERWPSMETLVAELDLAPPKSRLGAVVVSGALFVALAAGLWWSARGPQCTSSVELAAQRWSDARVSALSEAFHDSELPYAADTLATVQTRLDDYVTRWAEGSEQACRASSVEATRSRGVAQQRCWDRAAVEFETVVDALAHADAATVESAVGVVARLPDLEACEGEGELPGAPPVPPDGVATQVAALRLGLARVRGATAARELEAAGLELDSLQREAERVDYPPLLAEVELQRAELLMAQRRHDVAARAFERAVESGLRQGHERVALDGMVGLVRAQDERADHASALRWSKMAHALGDRLKVGEAYRARILHAEGDALGTADRPMDARKVLRRSVELRRAALPADHPDTMASLNSLGRATYYAGDVAKAEQIWSEVLSVLERTQGPAHPRVAALLNNLGALADDQGRYEEAIGRYGRAIAIREAVFGPGHLDIAATLVNLGNSHFELKHFEASRTAYERALEIRRTALGDAHPKVASILSNLGALELEMNEVAAAEAHLTEAGEVLRRAPGQHARARANLLRRQAWLEHDRGRHGEMLKFADEGLGLLQSSGLAQTDVDWARMHRARGAALLGLGRAGESVEAFRTSIAIKAPAESPLANARTYRRLAQALLAAGAPRAEVVEQLDNARKGLAGAPTEVAQEVLAELDAIESELEN